MADFTLIIKAVDQSSVPLKKIEGNLSVLEQKTKKVNDSFSAAGKTIERWGAAATAALAAAAYGSISYANAVKNASNSTEIGTQAILAFGQALGKNGGTTDQAINGIDKFNEKLGEARLAAGPTRDAFLRMGISMDDLANLTNKATFEKLILSLGNINDKSRAAAEAQNFFGKALDGVNVSGIAADYVALYNAQKDSAGAVTELGNAVSKIKNSWTRLELSITKTLEPIAKFVNSLSPEQLDKITNAIVGISAALASIAISAKVFAILGEGLAVVWGLTKLLKPGLFNISSSIEYLGKVWLKWGPAAWGSAITAGTGLFASLAATIGFTGKGLGYLVTGILKVGAAFLGWAGILYSVVDIIDAIFGTKIIDTFIDLVKSAFSSLVDGAMNAYYKVKEFFGFGGRPEQPAATPTTKKIEEATGVNPNEKRDQPTQVATAYTELVKQLAADRRKLDELTGGMKGEKDINVLAAAFSAASSEAEKFGIVLQKPTNLINRDLSIGLKKQQEELRQNQIEMANSAVQAGLWAVELAKVDLEIQKQNTRLADSVMMQRTFAQETAKANQELALAGLKLADAAYQQGLWDQSVVKFNQDLAQQAITLVKANEALAAGTITLQQYGAMVSNVDESLMGMNEMLAKYEGQAIKQVAIEKTKYDTLQKLREDYAAGTSGLTGKQFKETAKALGMEQDEADRLANAYGSATDRMISYNEDLKKSVKDAASTFSNEFSQAIVKGENVFTSFKNFISNILMDIANQIIKKQFADPIANAMSGAINSIINGATSAGGAGGSGGAGIFGNMFGAIGDWWNSFSFFADGGYVGSNKPIIVGEKGPEILTGVGGRSVIPNSQINQGAQTPDAAPTVNFTLNAVDTQTGVEFLLRNRPAIIKVVQDAYNTRGRRGPLEV